MKLHYSDQDLTAAVIAVDDELKHPNPARWKAMTSSEARVDQTYKALEIINDRATAIARRKQSTLRAFQGAEHERQDAVAQYELWNRRHTYFLSAVNARMIELKDRIKPNREATMIRSLLDQLMSLQRGISEHRDSVRNGERPETMADRILWDQMDATDSIVTECTNRAHGTEGSE